MVRRVVSLVRGAPVALRGVDPVLEANAFAVAEAVDLAVVLAGSAVELALEASEIRPGETAGVALPPAAYDQDLRGLLESGVPIYVDGEDLRRLGLAVADLVEGVRVVDGGTVARVLRGADAVLAW
ncbi:MAG: hypothetical protein GEU81_04410 [Nitriliruptorales bacterium]|nr:hypothetical protein [Nitriliruptorales bacterium]